MKNSTKTNSSYPDSATPETVYSEHPETPEPDQPLSVFFKTSLLWFLAVIFIFLPVACSEISDVDQRSRSVMADTLLGMTESRNATIEIFVDGRVKIQATAPRSVTLESAGVNRTDLFGPPVEIVVFDSLGSVETLITCEQATYNSRQHQFEFFGDVVVKTGQERVLRTEQLLWDEIGGRFNTSRFVTIVSPQDSITGYGFNGDQNLDSYNLRTVSGQFTFD